MLTGAVLDGGIISVMLVVALWSNSLALLADLMRGIPMFGVEVVLLVVMRRINRGKMAAYDYGTRKVEQFANLAAGATLLLAAAWLVGKTLSRVGVPQDQPALGLWVGAAIAAVNLGLNIWVFVALWRSARGGGSLIIGGQVGTRLTKVVGSGFVVLAVAVNAIHGPQGIGAWADILGTLVTVLVMIGFGWRMMRTALPHLLDRALAEPQQLLVNRALVAQFDAYDELIAVRTRTEGSDAWIEIELGFDPARPVGEAAAQADRVADEIRALVPGAVVLVMIRAAGTTIRPAVAA